MDVTQRSVDKELFEIKSVLCSVCLTVWECNFNPDVVFQGENYDEKFF